MNDESNVLVLEVDGATRSTLCEVLTREGYTVFTAATLAEAQQLMAGRSMGFVICGWQPLDGNIEPFVAECLSRSSLPALVILTDVARLNAAVDLFRIGVTDYILDPIRPEAVRQTINRLRRLREVESQLAREHRLTELIQTTAKAVILILDLEGKIVYANPFFERITGWEPDEVHGRDWFELCIPERDREGIRKRFNEVAHGLHAHGMVNPIVAKDGRERQIRWSNSLLTDQTGQPLSVLAIGVDVTDLLEAQQTALRSERLATIGQTMTALAHESRNGLQRIQAGVEMLSLSIPAESEARRDLDSIARAAKDLCQMHEELRSYAAPLHLHREMTTLSVVWKRAWQNLEGLRRGRDAELVVADCDCDQPIQVDVMRMEQMFRNLFENALAACQDPVRINLTCRCDEPDAIVLDIQDNGKGLSAEQREKVFTPFFTTKPTGTGLGLSIVQQIIQAHRGEIRLGEGAGPGASFFIRLLKPSAMPELDYSNEPGALSSN
ncbi:MAG: PAS domain S-box protein [Planctomycetaceae bacterium]